MCMQDKIIESLGQFKPYSIFMYGSRGRGDNKPDSDYEIGVIFEDYKYIQRSIIHQQIKFESVRIYPFKLSEIQRGVLDTPFQNSIYLRELIEGGKTIQGEKVIESLKPVKITTLDLIQRISFDIGCSLASLLSNRSGDTATADEEFSKSCLFGLRSLIILKLGKFVCGYDEIYKLRNEVLGSSEFLNVVEAAYSLREGSRGVKSDIIFENISFLDFVEHEIMDAYNRDGVTELA